MVVAGIGCRRGATAKQVEAALSAAIDAARQADYLMTSAGGQHTCHPFLDPRPEAPRGGLPSDRELTVTRIATPTTKGDEPGIKAAAAARGLPLALISQPDLEANNPKTLTRSNHSMTAMNVHSVAEAAALAGAGRGSRLLGPRIIVGPVTCALASVPSVADTAPEPQLK